MKWGYYIAIVVALALAGCSGCNKTPAPPPDEPGVQTQLQLDINAIEQYLDSRSIDAEQTASGLFYVIEEKGGGAAVSEGKRVKFHIVGRFLDNESFYSSYGSGMPLEIIVGEKSVVDGLEEGLQLLNAGGKATLYLPSDLGYGDEGQGSTIPPNTILIYEVEVLTVEDQSV